MAKAKKKAARKKPAAKKRKKSTALAKRSESRGKKGGKKSGKKKSSGKKKRAAKKGSRKKKSSRKKSRGSKKSHGKKKSSKHRGGWAKANRSRKPDAVLADVVGDKSGSTFNLVKRVWHDIKRKKIKKAKDRKGRHTVLVVGKDAALKKFAGGKDKLSMFHIGKQIKKHLVRSKKVANTGLVKRKKSKKR
jgi:chromatin remodeling complex protein RSC6